MSMECVYHVVRMPNAEERALYGDARGGWTDAVGADDAHRRRHDYGPIATFFLEAASQKVYRALYHSIREAKLLEVAVEFETSGSRDTIKPLCDRCAETLAYVHFLEELTPHVHQQQIKQFGVYRRTHRGQHISEGGVLMLVTARLKYISGSE